MQRYLWLVLLLVSFIVGCGLDAAKYPNVKRIITDGKGHYQIWTQQQNGISVVDIGYVIPKHLVIHEDVPRETPIWAEAFKEVGDDDVKLHLHVHSVKDIVIGCSKEE